MQHQIKEVWSLFKYLNVLRLTKILKILWYGAITEKLWIVVCYIYWRPDNISLQSPSISDKIWAKYLGNRGKWNILMSVIYVKKKKEFNSGTPRSIKDIRVVVVSEALKDVKERRWGYVQWTSWFDAVYLPNFHDSAKLRTMLTFLISLNKNTF